MSNDEISPELRAIIHEHIRSIDHAEVLLLLASAPDNAYDARTVAQHHTWVDGTAAAVLRELAASGIAITVGDGYRLAPSAVGSKPLAELASVYERRPVTLVRAISSAPLPFRPLIR